MSTVNATTIFTGYANSSSPITVGNSVSNITITSNSTYMAIGSNVIINTTAVFVGNSSVNTVLSTTGLTTNTITIGGVTTNTITAANLNSYNVFTTTGWSLWTKPAGTGANDLVTIAVWGGGGGGNNTQGGKLAGGGGGACVLINLLASQVNATCNVYVASGAAAGAAGQTSVFWTNSTFSISGYGGGGAPSSTVGGGGGGWFSAGIGQNGGAPVAGSGNPADSTLGGGGGTNNNDNEGGRSVFGGGGGSQGKAKGSNSVYGGAGGSGDGTFPIGVSTFGGNSANLSLPATAPGGGGCGANNMSGARGEVRVWVTKVG